MVMVHGPREGRVRKWREERPTDEFRRHVRPPAQSPSSFNHNLSATDNPVVRRPVGQSDEHHEHETLPIDDSTYLSHHLGTSPILH